MPMVSRALCPSRPSARPAAARLCAVESVEPRILFHFEVQQPVEDVNVGLNAAPTVIDLAPRFFNEEGGPVVRAATTNGNIDIQLLAHQAPLSVANFLNYMNAGRYDGVLFHRSVQNFVVQGGGYRTDFSDISPEGADPTVPNEFSPTRSNVRGTVAYAKQADNPNSATSEWFVNVANNAGTPPLGLDFQNGGFTVFGRVINDTMSTVDTIHALPRTTVNLGAGRLFQDVPIRQTASNPPKPEELVFMNDVFLLTPEPTATFTATSDDPLVVPTIEGNNLRLTYAAGQAGVATVTVTAIESTGATVSDTFLVSVGTMNVGIGTGTSAQRLVYTDADGTDVNVSVRGGAATLQFGGGELTQTVTGTTTTVTGTGIELLGMTVIGANANVTVAGRGGDGRVVVNGVSAAEPVRTFSGRPVLLRGSSNFAAGVGRLDLVRTEDATIAIGPSADPRLASNINIVAAEDTAINSQSAIRTLRLGGWTDTDSVPDPISAPSIGTMQVNGDFVGGLTVSGAGVAGAQPALTNARINGGVAAGTWNVAGRTSRVSVGSVGAAWSGTFGDVSNFTSAGDLSGTLTANSIQSLNAASMTGANVRLNQAAAAGAIGLARLNSRGLITNSVIRSAADIGTVTAGALVGSSVYAGVAFADGGVLPSTPAEFASASSIRSLTLRNRGVTHAFSNSDVAASTLGRMNLGTVNTTNGGVPFGLAARTIASLTAVNSAGGPIRASQLDLPIESLDLTDFKVRIFGPAA